MSDRTRRGRGDGTVHQRAATMDTNTEGEDMTLTEFLLARIAEDEVWAQATAGPDYAEPHDVGAPGHHDRVLADCAAKRVWVSQYERWSAAPGPLAPIIWAAMRGPVHHMAAIYADHPDYHEAWKP